MHSALYVGKGKRTFIIICTPALKFRAGPECRANSIFAECFDADWQEEEERRGLVLVNNCTANTAWVSQLLWDYFIQRVVSTGKVVLSY